MCLPKGKARGARQEARGLTIPASRHLVIASSLPLDWGFLPQRIFGW